MNDWFVFCCTTEYPITHTFIRLTTKTGEEPTFRISLQGL
jgi:hypothetical protein